MATRFLAPLSPLSPASSWFPEPLFQLQRAIDRVFEDAFGSTRLGSRRGGALASVPHIDVQEAEGETHVHADLPGVQPDGGSAGAAAGAGGAFPAPGDSDGADAGGSSGPVGPNGGPSATPAGGPAAG